MYYEVKKINSEEVFYDYDFCQKNSSEFFLFKNKKGKVIKVAAPASPPAPTKIYFVYE
jgi:hypothetical protein